MDEKLVYIVFTRFDGDGTWIERIRLDVNGPDLAHPEKVGYFEGYDPKGNGEIQFSPDGKWLAVYVGKERQGWFDARDAEVMTTKLGGDFLPSIKREINDLGLLGETMNAIHQPIEYGNANKGSLDFAEKGQHVFYSRHTLAMRNNSQSVLGNNTVYQKLLTANSNPYIVSEEKIGDIRRTIPFAAGTNTMNILATGNGVSPNLYAWNYIGYYSNDVADVNTLTSTNSEPRGFLPSQPHFISTINSNAVEEYHRDAGKKQYELTDHLGNVRVTLSDLKSGFSFSTWPVTLTSLNNPVASVVSLNNYYPGGMLMPGRNFYANSYSYAAANGQEKVDELSGSGNHYTAKYWEYDPRLISRWNVDPVVKSWQSSYACYSGSLLWRIDPLGDDDYKINKKGFITFKRTTGSDKDRLIARSGFLGLKRSTINVDKGVLNNIKSDKVMDGERPIEYNYLTLIGEEKGKALFEFLAKNTKVEWGRLKFGEDGFESSIITTSHEDGREAGATGLLSKPSFKYNGLTGHDHSHPHGNWYPSGSVHPPGSEFRDGDVKFAGWVQDMYSGKNIVFRIYTATDATYITYDRNTFLPLILKEVEISAPKIR